MVEPLTEHCTFPECGFDLALLRQNLAIGAFDGPTPADKAFVHVSAHLLATIDALLSQLREQRERAERAEKDRDYWRDDICETWMERADAAERTVREQREAKDHAYWERNQLVRVLSVMYPSYIALSDDPDWPIVYVELTTGQASWHIPATEIPTFNHLEWEPAGWDGHTDAEKYARLAALAPVADERNTCACCAAPADNHPSPDPWEGRLNDYCYACALTRCDAYAHPAPPVAPEGENETTPPSPESEQ
jgi:hypothetical protein